MLEIMKPRDQVPVPVTLLTFALSLSLLLTLHLPNPVLSGTLSRPLSPVKVLAAAGVADPAEKLRYYSFNEENERSRTHNHGKHRPDPSPPYSSKDPFEVPSLSEIAKLMAERERERHRDRDKAEHRDRDRERPRPSLSQHYIPDDDLPDTGWGWPSPRPPGPDSRERDRDRDRESPSGWGKPRPLPPPPPPPLKEGWGWGKENEADFDDPDPYNKGKGSFASVPSKEAFRPWQFEPAQAQAQDRDRDRDRENSHSHERDPLSPRGWGWRPTTTTTTTTLPPYTPTYLASNEDKYKPIRYPPGTSDDGFGPPGGGAGSWSVVKPSTLPPFPPPRDRDRDGWSSYDGDLDGKYLPPPQQRPRPIPRPRPESPGPVSGPGPLYLPPRHNDRDSSRERDPPPRPHRPPKWQDKDRDFDIRDRDPPVGWKKPAPEGPPGNGWDPRDRDRDRERPHSRPRPQPPWSNEDRNERPPPPPPHSSKGRGWSDNRPEPEPPRPKPRPPPSPGKGWGNEKRPQKPDLLDKHFSGPHDIHAEPDIHDPGKPDFPPGFKDRHRPHHHHLEEDLPNAPNTYRILPYTPSPEEIEKILREKGPIQQVGPGSDDAPFLSHSHYKEKDQHRPHGQDASLSNSNSNPNCGNGKTGNCDFRDKEKWYKENFQKEASQSQTTPSPKAEESLARIHSISPKDPQQHHKPSATSPSKRAHDRSHEERFKYIPYDHPAMKTVTTVPTPRDIYSNLELKDPFKRAVQNRSENLNRFHRLQGSESRTSSIIHKNFGKSSISLWKSEDSNSGLKEEFFSTSTSSSFPSSATIATTTTQQVSSTSLRTRPTRRSIPTPTSTTVKPRPPVTTRGRLFPRPTRRTTKRTTSSASNQAEETTEETQEFGRKTQVIRPHMKKQDQPTFSPFGFGTKLKPREPREALLEAPKIEIIYPGRNANNGSSIKILENPPFQADNADEDEEVTTFPPVIRMNCTASKVVQGSESGAEVPVPCEDNYNYGSNGNDNDNVNVFESEPGTESYSYLSEEKEQIPAKKT